MNQLKTKTAWEILKNPTNLHFQLSIYTVWHGESDFQVKIERSLRLEVTIRKFNFFRPIFPLLLPYIAQ